jgi:hypothetical protein
LGKNQNAGFRRLGRKSTRGLGYSHAVSKILTFYYSKRHGRSLPLSKLNASTALEGSHC